MKIRDIEVNFNFLDADDIEKFEKEAKKVQEESNKKSTQEMTYSEAIREECKIIDNFFDNVLGEGTSQKIFKGKANLEEHIKAFEDIVKEKVEQQKGLENTFNRYKPNREERRYNQYHNRYKK